MHDRKGTKLQNCCLMDILHHQLYCMSFALGFEAVQTSKVVQIFGCMFLCVLGLWTAASAFFRRPGCYILDE